MEAFHHLKRDIYVPTAEMGFWQGAFRDPTDPDFAGAREAICAGRPPGRSHPPPAVRRRAAYPANSSAGGFLTGQAMSRPSPA